MITDAIRCQHEAARRSAKARGHARNLMEEPQCAWAELSTAAALDEQKIAKAYYRFAREYCGTEEID